MVNRQAQANDLEIEEIEEQLSEELGRAVEAEQILRNPLVVEAFDSIKGHILQAWQNSATGQEAYREDLHKKYQAITGIEGILRSHLETGRLAVEQLQQRDDNKTMLQKIRSYWQNPEQPGVV